MAGGPKPYGEYMAKIEGFTVVAVKDEKGNVTGMQFSGTIPLTEFSDLRDGAKYLIPVKARDAEGGLLKNAAKEQLYVTAKGDTTTDISKLGATPRQQQANFVADKQPGTQHPFVGLMVEVKQATSKRMLDIHTTPTEVTWSGSGDDGIVGDLAISLKANNFRTLTEYKAEASRRAASRTAATVGKMSAEDLKKQRDLLNKLIAEKEQAANVKPAEG